MIKSEIKVYEYYWLSKLGEKDLQKGIEAK